MPDCEIECVMNISEGRDSAIIELISRAILRCRNCFLLDVSSDADHNRSVLTFVGARHSIGDAAFAAIAKCVETIDLRGHHGVHPRIGAADVVPFVPLRGTRIEDCIEVAHDLGRRVAAQLEVPVYLYDRAARHPGRQDLAVIRRGEFEGLLQEIQSDPNRKPDFGPVQLHPTAGATAIGARDFLIAFNVFLDTRDVGTAKAIARRVRERDGGLPAVKALGFFVARHRRAQVSTNLTDFRQTSLRQLFDAIREEARRLDTEVSHSEIIGLVPREALPDGSQQQLRLMNYHPSIILERRIFEVTGADFPAEHR